MTVRVILLDVPPEDFILATRAVRWLLEQSTSDGIVAYGEFEPTKDFYVRRNKASITVRPRGRHAPER